MNAAETLEELAKVANSINTIYNTILKSELESFESEEKYQTYLSVKETYLNYLKIAKEVEDETYGKLLAEECLDILEALMKRITVNKKETPNEKDINCRIIERLENKLLCENKQAKFFDSATLSEILEVFTIEDIKEELDEFLKIGFNTFQIAEELSITFITFCQRALDDKNNYHLNAELLKAKYSTIYGSNYLENKLIETNFCVNSSTFLKSRFDDKTPTNKSKEYKNIKNKRCISIVNQQVLDLLETPDEAYTNKKVESQTLLKQLWIKSALALMDDEEAKAVIYTISETITSYFEPLHLEKHTKNLKLIADCFDQKERDLHSSAISSVNKK